ncbi:MAG TPA: preprotein translocase subunit YajC [Candidatus Saccharimonadia bacterium]|nr:preprotein translocase subunit YajC [Candidatus Saccharimonadia bacterium]
MDFLISSAFAQGAPAAQSPSAFSPLIVMVVFFAIFYFIAIRPQMKRAKEHRAMLGQLAKGDEVVTSSGIAGRVIEIGDSFIELEVAPGTAIKLQRHAIGAVLPKGTLKSA